MSSGPRSSGSLLPLLSWDEASGPSPPHLHLPSNSQPQQLWRTQLQFPMNLHRSLPCLLTLCPERRGSARDTPSISRTPGDSVFGPHLLETSWPSMGSQPPWAVRILPLRKLSCEPRGVGWRVGSHGAVPGPGGWLRATEELRHPWG